MRKIIILILVLITIVNNVSAKNEYHCDSIKELGGLCFDVEFSVTTDKELNIPAKYNFPYFIRAGDYLYIKKIKVFNLDNATSVKPGQFILDIKPIDYSDVAYTDLKKVYPTNYGALYFNIGALKPRFSCEIVLNFEEKMYTSNCGEDFTISRLYVDLFKEGEWVIVDQYIPENRSGGFGHTSIFNGRWRGNTFKVLSGFEMDNLKDLKLSLKLILVTMLITIFLSIAPVYFAYKALSKEKQKEISVKIVLLIYLLGIVFIALMGYYIYRILT